MSMKVIMKNSRANWINSWGGDSTQITETAKALISLGVSVEIDESTNSIPIRGIDILHVFNIQTAKDGVDIVRSNRIAKVLSPIYWDMKHLKRSTYQMYPDQYDIAFLRKLARIHWSIPYYMRSIYKFNSEWWSHKEFLRQAKIMLQSAEVLLPNSHAELEIIVRTFSLPSLRTRSIIVPNAVDSNRVSVVKTQPTLTMNLPDLYVLEVGTFTAFKGQLSLLRAFLRDPSIPIVLVGRKTSERYWAECTRLAERRGNTFIFDQLDSTVLKTVYAHAKVHVLPSLRESPGLVSLEAAVLGANCVVSFHGPVTEYFGQDVWYCDPESEESIFSAVTQAWKARPSTRLRERILRDFTWDNAARQTLLGYETALAVAHNK